VLLTLPVVRKPGYLNSPTEAFSLYRIRNYGRSITCVDGHPRLRMTQSQVMEHLAKTVGINKKDAKLTLDELNVLLVRKLKKKGSIRLASFVNASSQRAWDVIPLPGNRSRFRRVRACVSLPPKPLRNRSSV
jgi:hypothetical protein